jgi:hypothetical protein
VVVAGFWRRIYNEELHNLYASPNVIGMIKIRRMRLARNIARMGVMRNSYKILVGKPKGKIPFGRPRHRWEVKIRMAVRKIELEGVD